MLTVKPNLTPHDQLRLLEAWEAWGIPIAQQESWRIQLFGLDCSIGLPDYHTYEALTGKEDQLELPLDYSDQIQTGRLL